MANADKRSVHTDALETLGTILTEPQGRDAIHLAVEMVTAGQRLQPGMDIKRSPVDPNVYIRAVADDGVGIVDPFIQGTIYEGDKFWLVVYPRKISSLRHVRTHPDFDDVKQDIPEVKSSITPEKINQMIEEETAVAKSVRWTENYAEQLSGTGWDDEHYTVTYDDLMEYADTWVEPGKYGGEYLVKGGLLEGESTSNEFWKHYTIVTGKSPKHDKYYGDSPNFFSCSC